MKTAIDDLTDQLPPEAQWWIKGLSPLARIEIDRLLREVGPANFATHWREHKADLDALQRSFDIRL